MTKSTVAFTDITDSALAGAQLGAELAETFGNEPPHAVIVFASARYDYTVLLQAIDERCRPEVMVGCSSAGEFINRRQGEYSACVVGLRSTEMRFAAGVGRRLSADLDGATEEIASSFAGVGAEPTWFHSALVLTDALSGRADELVEKLNLRTGGAYRFFGGGAGDDARYSKTHIFRGTEAVTDAAVALEILSRKPIGVGVKHGWTPASDPLRVTESYGMRLVSLDGSPAAEVIQEYAEETGQSFDPESPLSFFLHNVIGIDAGEGYKLRVPLGVNPDGSINCAAEIPEGATVHFMRASSSTATDAAASAIRDAVEQLQGSPPEVVIFFDCVATRLRMGHEFGLELQALEDHLGAAKYAGCNTYGQIARAPSQFSGFHNCTAVVCVIPGEA